MLDVPQTSHEENNVKLCLTWLKCSKTCFGPHPGENGLKWAFGTFFAKIGRNHQIQHHIDDFTLAPLKQKVIIIFK